MYTFSIPNKYGIYNIILYLGIINLSQNKMYNFIFYPICLNSMSKNLNIYFYKNIIIYKIKYILINY